MAIDLLLGIDHGRTDAAVVYARQGNSLLDGVYPRSEYPGGAVLLFALEARLGGGETETVNALLMMPFQLAIVCRRLVDGIPVEPVARGCRGALADESVLLAIPVRPRADGVPRARPVSALRRRWTAAGALLSVGTALKWFPSLSLLALLLWLASRRRWRNAIRLVTAFAAVLLLLHLPAMLAGADALLAPYSRQAGREITGQSIWYLPLRALGLADVPAHIWYVVGAPGWANWLAIAVQAVAVALIVALAALSRSRESAVAVAGLAPVVFLVTNRIFSPQFLIPMLVCWLIATALLARGRREQFFLAAGAAGASAANAFIFPWRLPGYDVTRPLAMALLWFLAVDVTAWLLFATRRRGPASQDRWKGSGAPSIP